MADVTSTVRAVVTVIDKATAPLRAIQSQFKAFGAGITGARRSMRELGDAAPLYKLGGAFRGVATAARGVLGTIAKIGAPIAALIGAGGIGGIAEAVNRFASQGEELQNLAAATGDTVEHLQELDHWAATSGVSVEALHKAMARTNKAAGEATHGNKSAADTFHALGIAVKDTHGHVRTFGEMAPVLADHFARITSATERARLGNKLFGKNWAEVVPLLARGKAELAAATEEAQRHGLLTDADTAASKRLGDAQRNLHEAILGVGTAISKRLAPALTPLIERLTKWIDANRDALAADIVDRIGKVSQAWSDFSDQVGGTGNALKIVAGIVAGITFAPLLAALAQLTTAFLGAASAMGLLNLAMLPWYLLAAALAAIVALGFLVYKNWDRIAAAARQAGDIMWAAMQAAWTRIKDAAVEAGQVIWTAITDLWTRIETATAAAWQAIWNALTPTDPGVLAIWDTFETSAKRAFLAIVSAITTMWADIRAVLPTWLGGSVAPPGLDAGALARAAAAVQPTDVGKPGSVAGAMLGAGGLAAAAAQPGAPGTSGRVDIVLTAPNQPPGTRIGVKTSGKNLQSRADVGYSMPQLVTPAGAP